MVAYSYNAMVNMASNGSSGTTTKSGRRSRINSLPLVDTSGMFADDQIFRLTSLAFAQPDGEADRRVVLAAMRKAGLNVTVNNLWILGWIGAYDKLAMARRAMADAYNVDIDADPDAVLYCGDRRRPWPGA